MYQCEKRLQETGNNPTYPNNKPQLSYRHVVALMIQNCGGFEGQITVCWSSAVLSTQLAVVNPAFLCGYPSVPQCAHALRSFSRRCRRCSECDGIMEPCSKFHQSVDISLQCNIHSKYMNPHPKAGGVSVCHQSQVMYTHRWHCGAAYCCRTAQMATGIPQHTQLAGGRGTQLDAWTKLVEEARTWRETGTTAFWLTNPPH